MDIVLGMAMAPSTIQMVLVEGENADGATVDEDAFAVEDGNVTDRVVAAILGTREGAREGGYELSATGVTVSDPAAAAALRNVLIDRKIENVMLVSAFLAAAALAQAVGNLTHYARTGLLFVEPDTATLAVVNSADGAIVEVHRRVLSDDDDRAVAELTEMVAGVDQLASHPDGVFVVGSGVNVAMIKPELDKASPLPVNAPEEPEVALARGAALASAHAPLFTSSTRALAWARDPGTGAIDPGLADLAYAQVAAFGGAVDYDATADHPALAYSAVPDDPASGYLPPLGWADPDTGAEVLDSRLLDFGVAAERHESKSFLVTGGMLAALFVVGVVALVIALAVSIRPTGEQKPSVRANVVTPAQQTPAPPAKMPAPQPQRAPAPQQQQLPEQHAPAPVPRQVPAPAPQAPAPAAPAPPPAAPPLPPPALPPVIPQLPIPILPAPNAPPGRWGGGDGDHGDHGGNHGGRGGNGRGPRGGGIPLPIPIPGLHF